MNHFSAGKLMLYAMRLPAAVSALAIVVMAVVVLADIAGRTIFGFAVHGAYEIIRICLCVSIFFGLVETTRQRAHITIDAIDQLVTPAVVLVLKVFAAAMLLAFLLLLIYVSWAQASDVIQFGDLTDDLRLSKLVFWGPILAGLCLAAIVAAADLLALLRH